MRPWACYLRLSVRVMASETFYLRNYANTPIIYIVIIYEYFSCSTQAMALYLHVHVTLG